MDILTNEKSSLLQNGQAQNFLVLCALTHQTNPRISLGIFLGLHYDYVFLLGPLGIGIYPFLS